MADRCNRPLKSARPSPLTMRPSFLPPQARNAAESRSTASLPARSPLQLPASRRFCARRMPYAWHACQSAIQAERL